MSYLRRLLDKLPKPFKFLQKQLDIQSQWVQFKTQIKPHRYKVYLLMLIISYPMYTPYCQKYFKQLKSHLIQQTHQSLQPQKPAFQIVDNLIKNLIGSILKDQNVKDQGLKFVNQIILDDKFVMQILQLLLSALKNDQFLNKLGQTSKTLILKQLRDPQITSELQILISRVASSPQLSSSFISLIQKSFSSQQSISTIISLLSSGISSQQVKQSVSLTINHSIKELLADEQTLNQLKVFIFFLLKKFQNDDQIKGIMDVLFAKGLGINKRKKNNRNTQLEKILRPDRVKQQQQADNVY